SEKRVRVALQLEGDTLVPASASLAGPPRARKFDLPRADRPAPPVPPSEEIRTRPRAAALEQWVQVPKGGEVRVDWPLRVERAGSARIRVVAETGSEADAAESEFPVRAHGIEKLVVRAGALLMETGEKAGKRTGKLTLE